MHFWQIQCTLAAANDSWVISPRRAKRASGEGSTGEHILELVKELVERSLGETGSGIGSDGRPATMRSSLADRDEDEPSTPSGSPTRSSTRPIEVPNSRLSKFKIDQAVLLPLPASRGGACCGSAAVKFQPSAWLALFVLAHSLSQRVLTRRRYPRRWRRCQ